MPLGRAGQIERPLLLVAIYLICSVPALARAGGYDYPDLGVTPLGRAGAFAARADDPLALIYNPAGAARLRGTQLLLSATLMQTDTRFLRLDPSNATNPRAYPHDPSLSMPEVKSVEAPFVSPMLMASSDLGGLLRPLHLVLMAGIYGPNSHPRVTFPRSCKPGTSPCEAASAGEGLPNPARYDTIGREVLVIFPSLGVAWRPLSWLSLGAVLQLTYQSLVYSIAVGVFVGENPANDVDVEVDVASGIVPTGILGLHLAPTRWLELGASFRFGYTASADGHVRTQLPADFPLDATTAPNPAPAAVDLPFPAVLRTGARLIHRDTAGRERFDVELDFVWEQTSTLERFVLGTSIDIVNPAGAHLVPAIEDVPVPHFWDDTISVRLGSSYHLYSLGFLEQLVLRAGALWESSALPTAFTRLDFLALERYGLTLGVGARFGRYRVDLAYAYLGHINRRVVPDAGTSPCGFTATPGCGSQVKEIVPIAPSGKGEAVGNGHYAATIHLFSLGVGIVFGAI